MKPIDTNRSILAGRLLIAVGLLTHAVFSWAIQLPDIPSPTEPLFSPDRQQIPPGTVAISPQEIPRLTWMAGQWLKQGKFADASFLCERLLQAAPGNIEARAHLAAAYMGLGDEKRFLRERDALARQAADSSAVHLSLASTYLALGKADQAEAAYLQGLQISKDKLGLLMGLGALYSQQQDLARAREQYLEVLKQKRLGDKPYLNASFALCRIDLQEKRYQETIRRAREIVTQYPPLPQGYLLLGAAYRGNGQPDMAISTYQGLIKANPQVPDSYHELALTYLDDLSNPEAALRYAREGVRRFPQDPRSLDVLGWVAYQTGHYPQAVEQFQQATRLSRGDPRTLYHLGLALQKSGNRPQAREAFQTALKQIDQEKEEAFTRELQKRIEQTHD